MIDLQLKGDGCWPDLVEKTKAGMSQESNEPLRIAALAGGTEDGRPSLYLRIDLPDGTAAYDIHLTAHGLDAMVALIQSDPKAQQIIPMLFLAKGFGKPEGDNMVWDIGFAHGRATVNGVPLGQNAGGESGVRPPASR